jgi:hypothetical protein
LLCVRLGLDRVLGASCAFAKSGRSNMKLMTVPTYLYGRLRRLKDGSPDNPSVQNCGGDVWSPEIRTSVTTYV